MKNILAVFLVLPLVMAAMAIPNANASLIKDIYIDGPDTAWSLSVGTVEISTTATDIQIVYTVDADWNITEVHCDVASVIGDIPQTGSGNPKVGKFDCNAEFAPGSEPNTFTCSIPIPEGKVAGDVIVVACHISVQLDESALPTTDTALMKYTIDGAGLVAVPETGWAADDVTDGVGGIQFSGKNWATYISYTIEAV